MPIRPILFSASHISCEETAATAKGGMVFAAPYNRVFRSMDSRMAWVPINTGLTKLNITCLTFNGPNL
jgi:hypothetical protein